MCYKFFEKKKILIPLSLAKFQKEKETKNNLNKKIWKMGFNLGILISGRGSNMLNIVNASKLGLIDSKVKVVISNNKNSNGISEAKRKNIKTKILIKKIINPKKTLKPLLFML